MKKYCLLLRKKIHSIYSTKFHISSNFNEQILENTMKGIITEMT